MLRLHKSESAFFVFMALILGAGVLIYYAYALVNGLTTDAELYVATSDVQGLAKILFGAGVFAATSVIFGFFLIFPLIRGQVTEGGKLRAMAETLSARSETLEQAALTDALTGVQNRRYFDEALREYIHEFRRIGKPLGLMILDLDHFKRVNDRYGHDVGDEVLRVVARCLLDISRYHDVVARLGGEEFAVVAPNMREDQLFKLAERIRIAVSNEALTVDDGYLKVTTSVGVAVWDGSEMVEDFYRRADQNLYEAKRLGRNRVVPDQENVSKSA